MQTTYFMVCVLKIGARLFYVFIDSGSSNQGILNGSFQVSNCILPRVLVMRDLDKNSWESVYEECSR